jgi:hypothetical protein
MNNVLTEGKLSFDFTHCGTPTRFDSIHDSGLNAVDFFVDTGRCMYFIEVKDYQNPDTPLEKQREDYSMLLAAGTNDESVFAYKMGSKIKDSILRVYAEGGDFPKNIIYLLFINLDKLGAEERGKLKLKISGQIPTGLNNERFSEFKEISFKLVDAKRLKRFGIICTENPTN